MVVRRVGILSLGKVLGAVYALLGLVIGAIYALFALLFAVIGIAGAQQSSDAFAGGALGVVFGIGSIIFFPIIYGIFGFLGGLLTGFVYNLVTRFVGGLEIDVEQKFGSRPL